MWRSLAVPAWGAASSDHYGLAVAQGLFDAGCAYLIFSDPNGSGESAMAAMFGIMGLGLNRLISVPLNGVVSATQNAKSASHADSKNAIKTSPTFSSDLRAGFTTGFGGHFKFYLGSYWQWKTVTLQARGFPWSSSSAVEGDYSDPNLMSYYPQWEAEATKAVYQNQSLQIALGPVFTRGTLEWVDLSLSTYSMMGAIVSFNYQAFNRTHAQAYIRYDFWASLKLPSELTAGGQILFLIW